MYTFTKKQQAAFGFSPLPGFEGSGGEAGRETNMATGWSFSPLPGFEGSGGSDGAYGAWLAGVSVPFRGLRGLEGCQPLRRGDGPRQFQSPSGV